MNHRSRRAEGGVVGGLAVIAVGLWFLLRNLGAPLPGIGDLWPIFPTASGLAFIVMYITGSEKDPGILIPGIGGFLVGIFFFLITIGPLQWNDMDRLWPAFPLIGGIAFLGTWWAGGRKEPGLLVPAAMGMGVGLLAFLFIYTDLRPAIMGQMWPLVLIVVGLWMLFSGVSGRYRR